MVRVSSSWGGSDWVGVLGAPAGAFMVSTTWAWASACDNSPVACSASRGVRSWVRNVTSASSCIGPGSGGRVRDVGPVDELERIEDRHRVGKAGRRRRKRGFETGEGPLLHHLLVSDLDCRGNLVGLLVGDDVHRTQETVALAGIDSLLLCVGRLSGGREFRRLGEIILTVEIEIERGADEGHAAKPCQRGAGKPPQ